MQVTIPTNLDLKITDECNFRCEMCKMWSIHENQWTLPTSEKLRLLEEYSQLSPGGMVYLTGGEPFRKEQEVFTLCEQARKLGIPVFMSSNGSYIQPNNARFIPKKGPRVLQFSLDSHLAEVHDSVRGFKGAHRGVLNAIDLINMHRSKEDKFSLVVNHIIRESNFRHLHAFTEMMEAKGVDKVKFQIIHPTINKVGVDPFYAQNQITSLQEFESTFRDLIDRYAGKEFLAHDEAEMEWILREVRGEGLDEPAQCLAYQANLVVNTWGDVQLCAHTAEIWKGSLGKFQDKKLNEIMAGVDAEELRSVMRNCQMPCAKYLGREQYFFSWVRSLSY